MNCLVAQSREPVELFRTEENKEENISYLNEEVESALVVFSLVRAAGTENDI